MAWGSRDYGKYAKENGEYANAQGKRAEAAADEASIQAGNAEQATEEALAAAEVARNAQGPKGDPGAIFDKNTTTGVGEIHWWTGTKAEYDAITIKNPSTIYYVRTV